MGIQVILIKIIIYNNFIISSYRSPKPATNKGLLSKKMAKKITNLILNITKIYTILKLLKLLQFYIIILNYINLIKQLFILALKILGLPLSKLILPRIYFYLITLPLLLIILIYFLSPPCLLNKYCLLRLFGTSKVKP